MLQRSNNAARSASLLSGKGYKRGMFSMVSFYLNQTEEKKHKFLLACDYQQKYKIGLCYPVSFYLDRQQNTSFPLSCNSHNPPGFILLFHKTFLLFSVTRRSRSDVRQSVTDSADRDFTDVTLVSDDTNSFT